MTTSRPSTDAEQKPRPRLTEFAFRLSRLPPAQRQALNLVGANGYSYSDAAKVAGCPIGTMKSRVARARARVWEKGSHGAPCFRAAILHAPDFAHLDKAA
jgi:RNA polymerase sigma-70 factor (ECF subfamily)